MGVKIIVGVNDLETLCKKTGREHLLNEWDYKNNDGKIPRDFSTGSGKMISWICPKGHSYKAIINSRYRGTGCKYCANKDVLKGFNDFETYYPELAKEWHPTKNEGLKPSDFVYGSEKKVWWKCQLNHAYPQSIRDKSKGHGCPICKKALKTSFPEQAIYYYIKKGFPDAINSYKEIFDNGMELDVFIPSIQLGIEYDGSIFHDKYRLKNDNIKYNICKQNGIKLIRVCEKEESATWRLCFKKIVIPNGKDECLDYAINMICTKLGKPQDVNVERDKLKIKSFMHIKAVSLKSEFPNIAKEWDYDKNNGLIPEQFSPHSNDMVNWRCNECGESWPAKICERTRTDNRRTGCPKCSFSLRINKLKETNLKQKGSLAETFPNLLKEWDYEKNKISPDIIVPGSNEMAWWKCSKCGYGWKTQISKRTIRGHGCRLCTRQDIVIGINDLTTTRPDLLRIWNYDKNEKGPECYQEFSNKKVFWKCDICGYDDWYAVIGAVAKGHGCPCCSGRVAKTGVNDFKTLYPLLAEDWNYENNTKTPDKVKPGSHYMAAWKCTECGHEWEKTVFNRVRNPRCPVCHAKDK